MHQIAVAVTQYLHLNVTRPAHQSFEINLVVSERRQRFAPRHLDVAGEAGFGLHHAHAAAAAAPTRLEHERIAYLRRFLLGRFGVPRQCSGRGQHRHAHRQRQVARGDLVSQHAHHFRPRADEDHAGIGAGLREIGILGQKSVARMDGIDSGFARDADDVLDVEVGSDRFLALAHQIRFVRLEAVQRKAVFNRVDGDGADAHFRRGPHDADGDFAAIGNENGRDFFHATPILPDCGRRTRSTAASSTR